MRAHILNALRALKAAPSFTAVALIVLTLGIGASTAIFSVVDAVVLRNVPFDDPDRLVHVMDVDTRPDGFKGGYTTVPEYTDWSSGATTFEAIGASTGAGGFTVRDGGHPESLPTTRVTASLFSVLRVRPQMGRLFTTDHEVDGNHKVVLISDRLWKRRFGGAADVVGKTMKFDSGTWEILGVMPEGFEYPLTAPRPIDMWVPYVVPASQKERGNSRNYSLTVLARLKPGATVAQAQAELSVIDAGIKSRFPKWNPDRRVEVKTMHESLTGTVRGWMLMLLGAVGFVMLIACVNVANLYLARATTRARDVGIRAALGASRWQLLRGVLVESLILSLTGAVLGVIAAYWGAALLQASLPDSLPRARDIGIDLRVLLGAAGAAVATGVLCGIVPAIQLSRPNVIATLRDGGRANTSGVAKQRTRTALIVAEVALAVVLLVGAGLFVASFVRVTSIPIGLEPKNVLTVPIYPPFVFADQAQREAGMARAERIVPEAIERIAALPGVVSVGAIANGLPLSGSWSRTNVTIPGTDKKFDEADSVDTRQASPDYQRTVGLTLLKGRWLEAGDATGPKAIVINDEAARRYFPGEEPVGKRIGISGERTVVGVVGAVRLGGPESEVRPEAYQPFEPKGVFGADLVIKTAGPADQAAASVRNAIWAIAPDLTLGETQTFEMYLSKLLAQRRFNMLLLSIFGVLGIVITAVGIYGVMAYIVEQRTQEIGVRMALGAPPAQVLGMMLTRAMVYVTVGLMAGMAGAYALSTLVEKFLFRVDHADPRVYLVTAGVLIVVGLAAAWIPSRRAARVDPMIALRH
jgi:putative ABC transport system permease protein